MPTVAAASTPTTERTARLAGNPYLIGNNVLERYNQRAQWRVSGTFAYGTDISDPDYPVSRVYDRQSHLVSRPLASQVAAMNSAGEVSLCFDLTYGTTSLDTVDKFIITGHNFHRFDGGAVITIEIDSDHLSDFSGAMIYGTRWDTNVAPWNVSASLPGRRLITNEAGLLGAFSVLSNIRYMRLRIRPAGDFEDVSNNPVIPEVGEIWMGRSRQLSYGPDRPFDNRRGAHDSVVHSSDGGVATAYVKKARQAHYQMTFRSGGADRNGLNQNTGLQQWWWSEMEGERKQTVFVLNPSSDTNAEPYIMMPGDEDFDLPQYGPFERAITLDLHECSPFYRREVAVP